MIGEGQGQNGAFRKRTCYQEVRRETGNLSTPHQRAGGERQGKRRKEAGLGANRKEVKQGQDCWLEQVQGEGETTSPSLSDDGKIMTAE